MPEIVSNRYEEDHDESMISKADAQKTRIEGKRLWEEMPTEEAIRERDLLIDKLDAYDKAAHVDTSKFREELRKNGNKPKVLAKIKAKLDKVAISEYYRRTKSHPAFNVKGKLGETLRKELNELHKGFTHLDLMNGDFSKIDILMNLDETLEPKAKFAERYNKQTKYVRELFEQSMWELGNLGSKEELLKKVLKLVGELEESPAAIQKEFKDRAKRINKADELRVEKAKLIREYAEIEDAYERGLSKYEKYYGGDTKEEFMDYIRTRPTLKEMRRVLSLLPKYNEERKKEHELIEEQLSNLPKKKADRFWKIVNKLGLSERKAYRKYSIEPAVTEGNFMVAEYEGELLAAHEGRRPLYTANERASLAAQFKKQDLKTQKALLLVRRLEIDQRAQVVKEYDELPLSVRDDLRFHRANAIQRAEMLAAARRELAEVDMDGAFRELGENEVLTDSQIHDITDELDSREGADIIADAYEEAFSETERTNFASVIDFTNAKAGHVLNAHNRGWDQEEAYARDLESWKDGVNEGDHEKDAALEADWVKASKIREMQTAKHLFGKGLTTYAGSDMGERQDVKKSDITDLKGDQIRDAMEKSRYVSTDTYILGEGESKPSDAAEILGDAIQEVVGDMTNLIIERLADKLNARGANRNVLINSLKTSKNRDTIMNQHCANELSGAAQAVRKTSKKKAA